MSALVSSLESLKSVPFPDHPDSDALDDWLLELAEAEGHIAGLAASVIAGQNARDLKAADLSRLESSILTIEVVGEPDRAIRSQGLRVLHAMLAVQRALRDAGVR